MKTLLMFAAAAALTLANAVQAQSNSATSNTQAQSASTSANAGNNQSTYFAASVIPDSTRIESAPALGSQGFYGSFSSDSCMVSAGVGLSVVGIGGQGTTPIRDNQCSVLRGVERTMQVSATIARTNPALAAKLQQGAIDMLCSLNPEVGDALKQQGVCTEVKQAPATANSGAGYTGNDPIVKSRLGLE